MDLKLITIQHRTRKDDISAFEILFKKYYAGLVNYAYSFTKDIDAAEEIVQEFFYNYWKNRKDINIKFSVKSYLYRAIRNNSLKYIEALGVRKRYADRVLNASKDLRGYESTEIELAELNDMIEDALNELPERCGQIFRLSRFEGLKYEEIADQLSVSVKTVEANMSKALKFLRVRLGKYYQSDVIL